MFSPSGSKIGWVGHDSSISVVQGGEGAEVATCVNTNLPFMTCVWLSESTLVAGGKFLFTILVAINVYLSYFSYYKLVTI